MNKAINKAINKVINKAMNKLMNKAMNKAVKNWKPPTTILLSQTIFKFNPETKSPWCEAT